MAEDKDDGPPAPLQPISHEVPQDPQARTRFLEAALGRKVRALRLEQGRTIADLAAAACISSGMLSKIENGLTSPSLSTLHSLAAALSVAMADFFAGFNEGPPDP